MKKQIPSSCSFHGRGVLSVVACVALLALIPRPASAQPDDLDDQIAEVRHQIEVIEDLRDVSFILRELKDHLRESDNIEDLLGEPGTARMMRETKSLLEKLSGDMVSAPRALRRYNEQSTYARQLVAAADLVITMRNAISEAETSSARSKIEDLRAVFGHMETLLPVIATVVEGFAVNPVFGAYFAILSEAMKNIAESAEKIEAATARTNAVIADERARALGAAPENDEESLEWLDEMLAEMRRRLRELDQQAESPAHTDVRAAEDRCLRERGIDRSRLWSLENTSAWAGHAMRQARATVQTLQGEKLTHELLIREAGAPPDLSTPEARLDWERGGRDRQAEAIRILRDEQATIDGRIAAAREAFEAADAAYRQSLIPLEDVRACVRRTLDDFAQHVDEAFLERYYSHYASASPSPAFTPLSSKFDSGAEGWTVYGDAQGESVEPSWEAGSIRAKDDEAGGVWYWAAPQRFVGNRHAFLGKSLHYRLKVNKTASPFDAADVVLVGADKSIAFRSSRARPGTDWTSFDVRLGASPGWTVEGNGRAATLDDFIEVLSDLKALRIRGEYRTGDDQGWLDEVVIDNRH